MNKIYVFLLFSLLVSLSVQADSSPLVYVPLDKPCRIVDTRGFASPFDPQAARTTQSFLAWGSAATLNLQRDVSASRQLGDCQPQPGLTPQAMAANITVAAKQYQAKGNVIVYPDGAETPHSSTLNFNGNNIASSAIVSLSAENSQHFKVTARLFGNEPDNQQKVDVIIDVSGFFYPPSALVDAANQSGLTYLPLPVPCRIVDTRGFASPFNRASKIRQSFIAWGSASELDLQRDIDGSDTLPACEQYPGATPAAMVANVTVAAKSFNSKGNIVAFPGGADEPDSSLLNFSANNIANTAIISLNTENDNHFEILARIGLQDDKQYKAHVMVDVVGYFYPQTTFESLSERPDLTYISLPKPCRLVDTRGFASPFDDSGKASQSFLGSGLAEPLNAQRDSGGNQQMGDCQSLEGVPSVLVGTMTAVAKGHHARGNLVAYSYGTTAPESSLVNFNSNNIANSLITPLSTGDDGRFEVQAQLFGNEVGNKRKVDLVVDATGYFVPVEVKEVVVEIEDAALKVCIQNALEVEHDVTPSLQQLRGLQSLGCSSKGISNLNGMSSLTGLTYLDLTNNQIADVVPLENLTSLVLLRLGGNQITDVASLENLTSLDQLNLSSNQITDVVPLENLTSLSWLSLWSNQIADVTPLENLTSLVQLRLGGNQITDVTPLVNLTSLVQLSLWGNQITDVTPLVNLTSLVQLRLEDNPVTDCSALVHVKVLHGCTVIIPNSGLIQDSSLRACIKRTLGLYGSDSQAWEELTILGYIGREGEDEYFSRLYYLGSSATPALTVAHLLSLETLNCRSWGIKNLEGISNLANLTHLDLTFIPSQQPGRNSINDLSPLAGLTKLTTLILQSSLADGDISTLPDLPLLTNLNLQGNQISDLTGLTGLPNLTQLNLLFNDIVDISPLSSLNSLTNLGLAENEVFDVDALSGMSLLNTLSLGGNPVSDCSPVNHVLNVSDCGFNHPIEDQNLKACILSNLGLVGGVLPGTDAEMVHSQPKFVHQQYAVSRTNMISLSQSQLLLLDTLNCSSWDISNLEGIEGLTNLTSLYLSGEFQSPLYWTIGNNQVSDLSPLSGLANLTTLNLDNGLADDPVPDCSVVAHVPNLSGC